MPKDEPRVYLGIISRCDAMISLRTPFGWLGAHFAKPFHLYLCRKRGITLIWGVKSMRDATRKTPIIA